MRTPIRKILLAAVAVASAAFLVPASPVAAATNGSNVPCLHAVPGSGAFSWSQQGTTGTATSGKGKKTTTQTTYTLTGSGTVGSSYELGVVDGTTGAVVPAASCVGAVYTFHFWSAPTFDLGWATTTTAPAGQTTAISNGGSDVVVTLAGDGVTSTPTVDATTTPTYVNGTVRPCLNSQVSITYNGTVYAQSDTMAICVPLNGGGGGYF